MFMGHSFLRLVTDALSITSLWLMRNSDHVSEIAGKWYKTGNMMTKSSMKCTYSCFRPELF
jgi:hypothetical protein